MTLESQSLKWNLGELNKGTVQSTHLVCSFVSIWWHNLVCDPVFWVGLHEGGGGSMEGECEERRCKASALQSILTLIPMH